MYFKILTVVVSSSPCMSPSVACTSKPPSSATGPRNGIGIWYALLMPILPYPIIIHPLPYHITASFYPMHYLTCSRMSLPICLHAKEGSILSANNACYQSILYICFTAARICRTYLRPGEQPLGLDCYSSNLCILYLLRSKSLVSHEGLISGIGLLL